MPRKFDPPPDRKNMYLAELDSVNVVVPLDDIDSRTKFKFANREESELTSLAEAAPMLALACVFCSLVKDCAGCLL